MRTRIISWVAGAVLVSLVVGLPGCDEQLEPKTHAPRPVVVRPLEMSDPSQALWLTGVVESWAQENIAFEVSGRVKYIIEEGTYLQGRWEETTRWFLRGRNWQRLTHRCTKRRSSRRRRMWIAHG